MNREQADALARQINRNTERQAVVKATGDCWFVLVLGEDNRPLLIIEEDVVEAAKLLYEAGVPLGVAGGAPTKVGPASDA